MDPVEILMHWLAKNYSKLILLAVVLIVAALIDKALTKVVRRVLDKSQVPNASIFVNIMRAVVWVFAIGTLLQPVFGINPTTIFTALGIGGLAVSLGLKDTIANVIGGFGLMLGRVIQPGDYVKVAGITGTVKDINWRQTIVRERNGNEMVIPNSILNTASLEKLDPSKSISMLVSLSVTDSTGVPTTEIMAVPVTPPASAMTITVPVATPVTTPSSLTVAMSSLVDSHVTGASISAGVTSASRLSVWPMSTSPVDGVTVTLSTASVTVTRHSSLLPWHDTDTTV